ncbi:MAG: DEAD/DEAH box helicase [Candidatus Onthomonas sp.]
MNFNDLNLPTPILTALSEQGYEIPTPIQAQAIPPALAGRDVLGCAQTGTGKTCAFAVPILARLSEAPRQEHSIRALILTPTRELAIQNQDCFVAYGAHLPLRSTVIFGGVGQGPQVEALQKGTDILVATPGRLADLYQQGYIDLSRLEIFVLDEADRMLDMGFIHDVKKILKWLPEEKQTLFFSATMPKEVRSLVDQLLHNPARIAVDPINSTVEAIDQSLYRTDKSKKTKLLIWLLQENEFSSVLVFTRTKHGANRVARDLDRAGISAAAIHGNKSQTARQAALAGFKSGEIRALVATDIAARGLDIEGLSCVVNYNLPDVPETYVHRIGRTGRAGQDGIALSFCDASELEELAAIEKQLGNPIPLVQQHPYPMEEMEVPTTTDKRGRRMHPEDAEARAAAQEQSRKRREKSPKPQQAQASAQPVQASAQPAAESQAKPEKPARQTKKQKNKPKAAAPQPEKAPPVREPVLSPEEDVGNYADLIRHRASYRPQERKPYSAASLDELLALPDFADELGYDKLGQSQPKRRNPLSGGKVMDATARMFLKGSPQPQEEPAPQPSRSSRRKKRNTSEQKPAQEAPAQQAPAKKQPEQPVQPKDRKGKAQGKKQSAQPKAAQPQAKPLKSAALTQPKAAPKPGPKSGSRHARPLPKQEHAASQDARGSLVRPYYLSDKKGKRG